MKLLVIILLAGLLFGTLVVSSDRYFELSRLAGSVLFLYLAWREAKINSPFTTLFAVGGAILLQPFYKINFTRELATKIDLVLACILSLWALVELILLFKKDDRIKLD